MNFKAGFRWFLNVLLLSAVFLAPILGQIHKTIHGPNSHHLFDHSSLSDHEEGSLLCQSLDHLASSDALKAINSNITVVDSIPCYFSTESECVLSELILAFSARAPPIFL
jgi:hypothetical protein